MSNYALLNVIDELKRIPGVGDASLFGAADYSMRIWLKPDKLAEFGHTPSDVAGVLRAQNTQTAAGSMGGQPATEDVAFTHCVTPRGRLSAPEPFREVIVRTNPDSHERRCD